MKHNMRSRLLAFLLTLAMLVAMAPAALADDPADGGGEGTDNTEDTQPSPVTYTLTGVTIAPGSVDLKVGEQQPLTATVTLTGSDGSKTTYNNTANLPEGCTLAVEWTVSNGRYAEAKVTDDAANSLSATLEALAVADSSQTDPLTVQVSVTLNGSAGSEAQTSACEVRITAAEPAGISLSDTTMDLAPNATAQIYAMVTPETADQTVGWTSANPGIAAVTAGTPSTTATVTAGSSAGQTTITATANSLQATCTVQVLGIVLKGDDLPNPLRTGKYYTLGYTIYGDSLKDKGVTWSSSDTDVVQISGDGYLYARSAGTATITAKINGTTYSAAMEVKVERATADVIRASAQVGSPLSFSSLISQLDIQSRNVLGGGLSYVSSLSVSPSQGTLYYRYTSGDDTGAGVATGETFYVYPSTSQMSLSEVTFVPKSDFSGTAVIRYTGSSSSGSDSFQGTIEVSVAEQQDVSYSTANGTAVQLNAYDFGVVCRSRTGRDLSYVSFTLPDSGVGTLYYNYYSPENPGTAVRSDSQYKYSGSPSIGDVYFVPASGFDGRAVVYYTAWDTNRQSYQGRMVIQVDGGTDSGTVRYSVAQGQLVTFDDDDFNTVSRNLTGYTLDCVRFTLPSASEGTLYYNYTSSGSSERVSASRSYYRSTSPYLDRVSFLAADEYTGTVSIPFTGWTTNGTSFSGTVVIRVGSRADAIQYKGTAGKEVEFQSGDFNDACLTATGSSLRYVRFTSLPSSSRGTLYYNYTSSGGYSSKVSTSSNYYRSTSPYLDSVSFVPSTSFSGTVSIPFAGWNIAGERFDGTVEVVVSASTVSSIILYTTAYSPVTFNPTDFRNACANLDMGTLSSVTFTTTYFSSAGHLYSSYDGFRAANTEVRSGTKYYLNQSPRLSEVTFVPKVGYQGSVWISYTGTNTAGRTYQGQVQIVVSPKNYSSYFSDLSSSYTWAAASVDYLYENGIVTGTSGNLYSPGASITRGQFVTMLDRALALPHTSQRSFPDVPSSSYYAASVQAASALGIVNGYGDGTFRPNAAITRADAMTMLYRAMQAVGWSLGGENTSILSYYSDGAAVPSYARGAMSVMIQNGILTGTTSGKLAPGQAMTRAEMAVVLARALTI